MTDRRANINYNIFRLEINPIDGGSMDLSNFLQNLKGYQLQSILIIEDVLYWITVYCAV